jgi:hypothetical protein
MTSLSIVVSEETNKALRRFLGGAKVKKDSISAFVERAVRKEIALCTIQAVKERNAVHPVAEVEASIDDALRDVRASCS